MRNRRLPRRATLLAAVTAVGLSCTAGAADVTWTNAGGDFLWNTTSPNWSSGSWNNASIDGAIFGSTGVGTIQVAQPIVVDSIAFRNPGYVLDGPGPITFQQGVSTETTGVVNVAAGASALVTTPLTSSVGFQKIGPGALEISGAGNHTGAIPITSNGFKRADVLIGGTVGTINGGTLRVMTQAALPQSTRVSIGTG
ncbi:MAG: hypothetical protein NZ561_13200 [Phycisphaerae bacterium]|nr:hypothetical protein [Phycisphaerae bacterium]MDW8261974.1 hypothetical protein [Phycisphaerales bacterium]